MGKKPFWYRIVVTICVWGILQPNHFFASSVGTTAMDFFKLNTHAKAEAMGNTLTASQGIAALSFNPASVADANRIQIDAYYLGYVENISYKSVSIIVPTQWFNLGANAGLVDFGSQVRTTFSDRSGSSSGTFSNNGYHLTGVVGKQISKANIGVALSYISQKLDQYTSYALGLSSGVRYQVSSKTSIGLSLNKLPIKDAKFISDSAPLSKDIRMGVMHQLTVAGQPLTLVSDVVVPDDDDTYLGLGGEYQLNRWMFFRSGMSTASDTSFWSIGLGLKLSTMRLDFTYKPNSDLGQQYRVGVGMDL